MGLGLPVNVGGSGDFKKIIKYDAKAGRLHRSDRVENNGQFDNVLTEITNGFAAVFDLANIEVGYALFAKSVAPQWVLVKIGQTLPAKPSKDFKQAFRLDVKLAKSLGGDVRELGSSAACVIASMDALYDAYLKAPERAAGKLPVVSIPTTTIVTSGESKNYAPNFTIVQWVDRPAELPLNPVSSANMQAPLSTPVPPPVAVPQPAQTASVATEF